MERTEKASRQKKTKKKRRPFENVYSSLPQRQKERLLRKKKIRLRMSRMKGSLLRMSMGENVLPRRKKEKKERLLRKSRMKGRLWRMSAD